MLCLYDKIYLRTAPSIIKILQIITLFIAFAAVLSFDVKVTFVNTVYSRIRFFILVAAVGWFSVLFVFCLNLFRLTRNLPIPWHWVNLIIGVVFSLFMLISSALLANNIDTLRTNKRPETSTSEQVYITECEFLENRETATSCSVAELGTVFGFIAVVLFVADIVVAAKRLREGDYSHDTPTLQPSMDNATVSSVVQ